jgi:hypothetical protein
VDGGDQVLRVRQAVPGALSIDSTGNIGAFISFRPAGTSGTQGLNFSGTLMLCDEHGNTVPRGLIVSPSGRIQVSRDVDHLDQPLVCA